MNVVSLSEEEGRKRHVGALRSGESCYWSLHQ